MATTKIVTKDGTEFLFPRDFAVNYVPNDEVSPASNTRSFNKETGLINSLFRPRTTIDGVDATEDAEGTYPEYHPSGAFREVSVYDGLTVDGVYVVIGASEVARAEITD